MEWNNKKELESHKFANIIPMASEMDFEELKEDIKKHGLLDPIVLYEGKILDGRNRYNACKEVGVEPRFEQYKGNSPLQYVISQNVKRRHLTKNQRAALAADDTLLKYAEEEAQKRHGGDRRSEEYQTGKNSHLVEKGRASESLANLFGVNERYIREAKKVKEEDPEWFNKIKEGKTNFSEWKKEQRKKKFEEQRKKLEEDPPKEPKGKYEVIVVDPPWSYEQGFESYHPESKRGTTNYPVMTIEELKKVELPLKEDAVVWLWVTNSMLKEAIELTEIWGLERKTILTWDKQVMGVGKYLRNITEHCILCFKGNPVSKGIFYNTKWTTLISEKRTTHSTKPEIFYKLVEDTCVGRKLDYFGRKKRESWDVFGDEVKE